MNREIVVYKGEDVVCQGTVRQCARHMGIKPSSMYYYLMPAYQRKVARRKRPGSGVNIITVVEV